MAKVESSSNVPLKQERNEEKEHVKRKLFSSQKEKSAENSDQATTEDDMLTDDFDTYSKPSLDITCNVVSMLPREYDQIMEVEEPEDATVVEMARHMPVCYYVMNNGSVEEKTPFLKGPTKQ